MRISRLVGRSLASLFLIPLGAALADGPSKADSAKPSPAEEPGVSLFDAARSGQVALAAEGTGDGRMTLRVTNQTNRKLKVVLPPGLAASGVTGQFGGMGGMGGGMGGMGGGMGGMGGGMGGMGGGMGGMGGGGMGGGGMGGGGMGGGQRMLTMMPLQGLSSVASMIMNLVEPETWDRMAFMRGMMAAMGSMGGGGMGGMGGGMGGGMMGGMGGGMRSVPPTDLPAATLAPGQSRDLKTRLVRLGGPNAEGGVDFPAKGEPLTLSDVAQTDATPRVQAALRRLARDSAPESISQVALWGAAGMPWADVARLSRDWANPQELALARQMVADLDAKAGDADADNGRLLIEVTAKSEGQEAAAARIAGALAGKVMLGLAVEGTVPARPSGPAVACKVQLSGTPERPEALVQLACSDADASAWAAVGKFELPVALDGQGQAKAEEFADALAEGLLNRLVKVTVRKTSGGGGAIPALVPAKQAYTVRVENYSPLLLNGIAVSGAKAKPTEPAKLLVGISLSPRRALAVHASAESVEKMGLKDLKVVALDLSGL